jgi:hypothetical protein
MDSAHEDCFVVFARADGSHGDWPEGAEQPLAICRSYQEARRVQRALQPTAPICVIRYVGPAGGGD